MSPEFLFVYGTLRRALERPMHRAFAPYAEFRGEGFVEGRLWDLGFYPALEYCPGFERVRGELYELSDATRVFTILDAYEECRAEDPQPTEYVRRRVPAEFQSGARVQAWTYIYNWPLTHARLIAGGDYLGE